MSFTGEKWDENAPTNADLANEIDDYMRDIKIAVRSRLAHEHNWSASQTATGSDGGHRYITLTTQTSAPSLVYGTSTQAASIFACTANHLNVADKTGVVYTIVKSAAGLVVANGTGTLGAIPYVTSGGGTVLLGAGTSSYVLTAAGAAAPAWAAPVSPAFGTWTDKSGSYAAQTASADGYVLAIVTAGASACGAKALGYTDNTADPSTLRAAANVWVNTGQADESAQNNVNSFTMPVKSGDSWKVVLSSSGNAPSIAVYWIDAF